MEIFEYLNKVNTRFKRGDSTEHSYRPDLQNLLESLLNGIAVTNEPKRIECGAPDYILSRGSIPVGYIEAKDVDKRLEDKSYQEQFDRYKESLDNLIITNYLEFIFVRDAKQVASIKIGKINNNSVEPLQENFDSFLALINDFVSYQGQTITSSIKLATLMAGKARLMANILGNALEEDVEKEFNSELSHQFNAFKSILIHDIDPHEFADIYAQTIAYGMFAARLHDRTLEDFSRNEAAELIPKSNPFLRKLFHSIAGPDLDSRIDWIVDALADIFRATNVAELLKDFGKSTQKNDPCLHFYETFLAEYNPSLRKSRGVWYTPEPVVSFIVQALDDILKNTFSLKDGLADTSKTTIKIETHIKDKRHKNNVRTNKKEVHKVQILDPAAGTGTFLTEVIKNIYIKFSGQQGIWPQYLNEELLPRLNGFEILMAPYAMAHLKMEMLLEEMGFLSENDKRLPIYLTNSLEEHHPDTATIFSSWLSNEASEANHIKRDTPVMVILGNPPYSGQSSNNGDWINNLLEIYKQEPGGGRLNEKNTKWLNDDYVKFIRYGQFCIEKNGEGVLAYINNHSYLDNPTFRGMRWSLLNSFSEIYIIDLHGNTKKKEISPDGSPDKNVFDIQQGVSINIFIKKKSKKKDGLAKVFHYDLFGLREEKYKFLWDNSLYDIPFVELKPHDNFYFFTNKNFDGQKEYESGFKITDLFEINSVGIATARDSFTIHNSANEVKSTIDKFLSLSDEEAREKFSLGKDVRDWKVHLARKDLVETGPEDDRIIKLSYRPFDDRYTYYTGKSKGFHCMPRGKVMDNYFHKSNVGLLVSRMTKGKDYAHVFVTESISEVIYLSPLTGTNAFNFPLYIYSESYGNDDLLDDAPKRPNLNKDIINIIESKLNLKFSVDKIKDNKSFSPLDIFDYVYSVLHSNKYRNKYSEFLKIDFPFIPYPRDENTFRMLTKLGERLRNLHLLKSDSLENYITTYPISGDNIVTRSIGSTCFEYVDKKKIVGRVKINEKQYFDNVPFNAWNFFIGGYQPAQKWLKDRKGCTLDHNDIFHYQKIIVALVETDRVMREIDELLLL